MGEVINSQDAYNWSISRIATAFGKDRRTVTRRLQEAGIEPAGFKRGNAVYALADAAPTLFGEVSRGEGGGVNFDEFPEARKAWYQSENERLKFEKEIGRLIPDDEYARELSFLAKTVAAGLDSLPDMLERDAGLSPEALERAQVVIDSLREQLYHAAIANSGGDDDGSDG